MYNYQCPDCGAMLDPGERCDCDTKREVMPSHDDVVNHPGDPSDMRDKCTRGAEAHRTDAQCSGRLSRMGDEPRAHQSA